MKLILVLAVLLYGQVSASLDHGQTYLRQLTRPSPLRMRGQDFSGKGIVEAGRHSYPFMLSLQAPYENRMEHMCSAILINEKTVLSPASCVLMLTGLQKLVFAGAHHLSVHEERRQAREVTGFTVHPKLQLGLFPKYDFAVLSLNASFELNNFIMEAPEFNVDPDVQNNCTVAGWYNFPPGPPTDDVLQMANVTLLGRQACEDYLNRRGHHLPETSMCAGLVGEATGWMDYGGPLICDHKLAGITGDPILQKPDPDAPIMVYNVSSIATWVGSFVTPIPLM